MKRIGFLSAALVAALVTVKTVPAQNMDDVIVVPNFDVRLSMGFNYDLLRPMTNVSFDYPVGYFGFNVPLRGDFMGFIGDDTIDDIFQNADMFKRGDNFRPTASAAQNTNYTVRVDVPMIGGVGSFAYTQNFFFNFSTALGGSNVLNMHQDISELINSDEMDGVDDINGFVALRGALRLPLNINMGWETMTLGYAYRPIENVVIALNLHRHLFSMDANFRADIDLLGHAKFSVPFEEAGFRGSIDQDMEIMNYSSEECNGTAHGRFRAEAWTPSVGLKWGRLSLNSRFGMKNIKAKGTASGGFVAPAIVNLETGDIDIDMDDMEDITKIFDMISDDLDSIRYEILSPMVWSMPQGHTIGFEIVSNRVTLSYTKLFGDINLRVDNIARTVHSQKADLDNTELDTLNVDVSVKVDHIFMLQVHFPSFYFNLGLGGIEGWSTDREGNRIYAFRDGRLKNWRMGDVMMVLPILSGGVNLGSRLQLRLEADVLPLPAFRTGVNYYF